MEGVEWHEVESLRGNFVPDCSGMMKRDSRLHPFYMVLDTFTTVVRWQKKLSVIIVLSDCGVKQGDLVAAKMTWTHMLP